MAPIYDAENLPKSKSWINKLTAPEAVDQCLRLGLTPDKTLDANRYIIAKYYETQMGKNKEPTDSDGSEEQNPEKVVLKSDATPPAPAQVLPAPGKPDATQATTSHVPISLPVPLVPQAAPSGTGGLPSLVTLPEPIHQLNVPEKSEMTQTLMSPGTDPHPASQMQQAAPAGTSSMTLPPSPEWKSMLQSATQALGQLTQVMANMAPPPPQTTPPPHHAFSAAKELIAAIPQTSGEEPRPMIKFVLAAVKIAHTKLVDEASLPVLLLPRTTGRLRVVWVENLAKTLPWPQFLKTTLNKCLPPRVLNPITYGMLYEHQGYHQPLSDYLSDLTALVGYFYPEIDQKGMLDLALTGVNNTTRIALSLFPTPTSVDDLMELAPRIGEMQRPRAPRDSSNSTENSQQSNQSAENSERAGQSRDQRGNANPRANNFRRNNNYRRNSYSRGRGSNTNAGNAQTNPTTPANQGNQTGGSQ